MHRPKYVGGDNVHTAGLHFNDFLFPLFGRIARIVELTHHRYHGLPVANYIIVIYINGATIRSCAPHLQMLAAYRFP